jgi:hypothetical protein
MSQTTLRSLIAVPVLLVLLCVPSVASADTVTWNLSATFDDLGTALGSFDYDVLTNMFSNIHIVTTPDSGLSIPGATYTALLANFGSSASGMILGATSGQMTDALFLMFGDDLTDFGGSISLTGMGEGICNNADCSDQTQLRAITTGGVVGIPTVPTPEPSGLLLLGMGLVGLLAGAGIRKVSHA